MILVTGATGLLGNCVVRELLAQNQQVRVLCRSQTPAALDGLDVEVVRGDITDPSAVESAVSGCTAVVHSAAMIHIGWQKLEESRFVNVQGTRWVTDACIRHSAKLLHISTVDTLPAAVGIDTPIDEKNPGEGLSSRQPSKPKTPCTYVVSKTESEKIVRQVAGSRLDAAILHPGFMLGPFDWKPSSGRMMLEIHRAPLAVAPSGGCSVCDARDVASAIVASIQRAKAGESYILAGYNMSYRELWSRMFSAMGVRRRVFVGGPLVKCLGYCIDQVNRLGFREGDINGAAIAMGNLFHYYDSSLARTKLSYHNRPLDETLADAWSWLTSHHLSRK